MYIHYTLYIAEQGLVAKLAGEGIIKEAKTEAKKHGPCEVGNRIKI